MVQKFCGFFKNRGREKKDGIFLAPIFIANPSFRFSHAMKKGILVTVVERRTTLWRVRGTKASI